MSGTPRAPDGTFEIFGYNEADHTLDSHLRRDGVTVTYDYDAANRVTLAAPSGGVPATMVGLDGGDWVWGGAGRLHGITGPGSGKALPT